MKIYVASSWRNSHQQNVVHALIAAGHEVYDFKNPPHGKGGFQWSHIDPNWQNWTTIQYIEALNHEIAKGGFEADFNAMKWADVCVMVLPCGRSANTEAGWMKGAGKKVFVYQPMREEPELMYKIYDEIVSSLSDLIITLDFESRMEMTKHEKIEFIKKLKECGVEPIFLGDQPSATGFRHKDIDADLSYIAENIKHITRDEWENLTLK